MKLWITSRPGECLRMISACRRLKLTTWSEEKRRKSIRAAGFASVTVPTGSSTCSKFETSIDQKTLPHARFSASGDPYFRFSHARNACSAASE